MPNNRTGQDFIDYYEKKQRETGKTTLAEKLKYTKEQAKLRKQEIERLTSNN